MRVEVEQQLQLTQEQVMMLTNELNEAQVGPKFSSRRLLSCLSFASLCVCTWAGRAFYAVGAVTYNPCLSRFAPARAAFLSCLPQDAADQLLAQLEEDLLVDFEGMKEASVRELEAATEVRAWLGVCEGGSGMRAGVDGRGSGWAGQSGWQYRLHASGVDVNLLVWSLLARSFSHSRRPLQFAARSVAQHELAHSRHEASGLAVELEEARHSVAAAQAQASTAFGRIIVLEKALTAAMQVSVAHCNREHAHQACQASRHLAALRVGLGLLPARPLLTRHVLHPPPACARPQDASQLQHVLVEQQSVRMELQQSQADAQQLQVALADSHRDLEHLMVALTRSQEDATSLATQLEEARNEAAEAQTAAASARGRITVLERAWSAALDVSTGCRCCTACCCSCCCTACCCTCCCEMAAAAAGVWLIS
jgi:hypothetical protein